MATWYVIVSVVVIVCAISTGCYLWWSRKQEHRRATIEQEEISHDLHTLLTLISAPVDNILAHEHITASVRNQLEIVQANNRKMLEKVNRLMGTQPKPEPTIEEQARQAKRTLQKALDIDPSPKSSRKILVVDDNEDMRRFLKEVISKEYTVLTAEDGVQALEVVRKDLPDLIITDLTMPNMDGLELTQRVKAAPETSYIPLIMLTAKSAIESRLQALEYGADDYVTKPFEPVYLRARVHNILAQREKLEKRYRERLLRMEPEESGDPMQEDKFLAKLLKIMDKEMDNNALTVEQVVEEMGLGRTVFYNRLKAMTGLSPVEFIREIRIKRAAQLLSQSKYNITEVTYMVGMNDSRYFSKCFKNTYGVTPSEYKRDKKTSK